MLGFADVDRAILETSLTRSSKGYPSWKDGERLLASASYYRLSGDAGYVRRATPALAGFLAALERAFGRDGHGLLARERYSADIADAAFGTHAQTVAWAGVRAIADVWDETGRRALATRARALATRLEDGLRAAVRASERRLSDGSLFVPARLLDDEAPYPTLVETRLGRYWNLVMPYALSSGFFAPGRARHAAAAVPARARLATARARAGRRVPPLRPAPPFPVSGTDEVYGIDVARFLADEDEADQLVLSLYGTLGAALTPGTYVGGEGAALQPLEGRHYRTMYLPPNNEVAATFLETLRLMLVHESADAQGGRTVSSCPPRPRGRGSRRARGSRSARAPTSFGPVSFSIVAAAGGGAAHVHVLVPSRRPPMHLAIRLRFPSGATRTIDLTQKRGAVDFDVRLASR